MPGQLPGEAAAGVRVVDVVLDRKAQAHRLVLLDLGALDRLETVAYVPVAGLSPLVGRVHSVARSA